MRGIEERYWLSGLFMIIFGACLAISVASGSAFSAAGNGVLFGVYFKWHTGILVERIDREE